MARICYMADNGRFYLLAVVIFFVFCEWRLKFDILPATLSCSVGTLSVCACLRMGLVRAELTRVPVTLESRMG